MRPQQSLPPTRGHSVPSLCVRRSQCSPVQTKVYTSRQYCILCCTSLGHSGAVIALLCQPQQNRWLWVWRTQWHGLKKKNSFHSGQTKSLSAHAAYKPIWAWPGLVGEQCMLGTAPPNQLSSLDSPIEMNDVHEYYSIYCCDSYSHATMKSPERCPPIGE